MASFHGHLAAIKCLMEEAKESIDPHVVDVMGRTPYHVAAALGQAEVAAYFVRKRKIDLEARDNGGHTPLSRAIYNGEE